MDDELWEPDEEDLDEYESPIKYDDRVQRCPKCKKDFLGDLDCCPYCGDILFRHLKDGIFAPSSRLWAQVLFVVIVILTTLAVLMLIF